MQAASYIMNHWLQKRISQMNYYSSNSSPNNFTFHLILINKLISIIQIAQSGLPELRLIYFFTALKPCICRAFGYMTGLSIISECRSKPYSEYLFLPAGGSKFTMKSNGWALTWSYSGNQNMNFLFLYFPFSHFYIRIPLTPEQSRNGFHLLFFVKSIGLSLPYNGS